MDIQRKAFESSNNVNPDWSFRFDEELQQYVALDSEMELQVDEFNEHWDTFRAGWQAAKAQAVPEGFVLMPKEPTDKTIAHMINTPIEVNLLCDHADVFLSEGEAYIAYQAMIEAQEPAND